MTRVIVADDDFIFREGLGELLATRAGMDVVGACGDLEALLEGVEGQRPDVVITDIRMPPTKTTEGIQAAMLLRESHPQIGVVVLSQHADAAYVLALLESGSNGRAYLLKERLHDIRELSDAIETVQGGGSVIDPKVVELLVSAQARTDNSPLKGLSERERTVLAEIALGKSNLAIAQTLRLSQRSVEKHTHAIFVKLGLSNVEEISKRVKAALLFLAEGQRAPGA
ncbi:MAG: response regulator transcription factor [Thermoleophilaceae bacterium]